MIQINLPARWRLTTLGEIARAKPNNGLFRKNPEYLTNGSGGLPVVWVEELFRGNSIDTSDSRRVTATKAEVEKYGLKKGDVLFCRSSLKLDGIAFNNVYLGEDNAALFECHIIRISPKLTDVSPVFLNWLLRSPHARAVAKSKSKTATMTTIDQQSLASIPIVLPPLAEQRRIAEVLDRAEALRAKRRAALAQLDNLTQSLFLDLFGDPATNPKQFPTPQLRDAIELRGGFAFKSGDYVPDGIPLVRIGEVNRGSVARESACFLPETHEAAHVRFVVRPGDMLMSLTGTTGKEDYGNVMLLKDTFSRYFLNQRVALIDPRPSVLEKHYLLHVLRNPKVKARLTSKSRGIRQANISNGDVLELQLPLPPIELQREFARRVRAVENLKTTQRAALAELDELFASLQHRAFRGEL